MNSEVDQFGRSAIKSDDLSDDKSKRILEALSDIKNQLQNDEYIPKVEKENLSRPKDSKKDISHDLDFKNLYGTIKSIKEIKKDEEIVISYASTFLFQEGMVLNHENSPRD